MLLTLDTGAAAWPVTDAEIKENARITSSVEDDLVTAIKLTATAMVEEMADRELSAKTWTMSVASVRTDLVLPKAPVDSVTAISYYDAAGDSQSLTVGDFYLFKDDDRAYLRPKPNVAWPALQDRDDALSVTFTTGYDTVPFALKHAVLLLAAHLFEHREVMAEGVLKEMPFGLETMINLYRRGWVRG